MSDDKLSAAIDCFGKDIYFAAYADKLRSVFGKREFSSRNSSDILPWICDLLRAEGYLLADIGRWTAGTGPNTFTVLRVLSSLVSGFTFGNRSLGRGIPSACAIASSAFKIKEAPTITVLFAAPANTLFYHTIDSAVGFSPLESGFLNPGESGKIKDGFFAYLAKDSDIVASFFKEESGILNPHSNFTAIQVDDFPVEELARVMPGIFDRSSLRDLIYLRPPVDPML